MEVFIQILPMTLHKNITFPLPLSTPLLPPNQQNLKSHTVKVKTQNYFMGTFLVVQWLRLCTPNAGGLGLIPGRGIRSHMP